MFAHCGVCTFFYLKVQRNNICYQFVITCVLGYVIVFIHYYYTICIT